MHAPADIRRKQLAYRAAHRGCREADAIFSTFSALHLPELDEAELEIFAALLDVPDPVIFDWLVGDVPVPREHNTRVFERLKTLCERKHPDWNA